LGEGFKKRRKDHLKKDIPRRRTLLRSGKGGLFEHKPKRATNRDRVSQKPSSTPSPRNHRKILAEMTKEKERVLHLGPTHKRFTGFPF